MAKKITIVIPTYNEKDNIGLLTEKILQCHPDFNIIVVDDNSPDGTGEVIDRLAENNSRIHAVHRAAKSGLGKAYVEGFKIALAQKSDLIFEMDADLSHDPEYIKDFLHASENADLVIGSRYLNGIRVSGWRLYRLLISLFANILVSFFIARPVRDFTAGYRCYRRQVLEKIDLDRIVSDGYAFQIEMTYLSFINGFRVTEIPIIFKEREYGRSKLSLGIILEALWLILRCRASVFEILKHLGFLLNGKKTTP